MFTNLDASPSSRITEAANIGTDGNSLALLMTYTAPEVSPQTRWMAALQCLSRASLLRGAKAQDCGLTKASYSMYCSSIPRKPLLCVGTSTSSSEELEIVRSCSPMPLPSPRTAPDELPVCLQTVSDIQVTRTGTQVRRSKITTGLLTIPWSSTTEERNRDFRATSPGILLI